MLVLALHGSGSAFRFAGAAAVLVMDRRFVWPVLEALALDQHFLLRHARDDIMSCQG